MDETVLINLLAALETIHSATSTNESRQQAQEYCEDLKRDPLAPLYGYYLAHKDNQQPNVVRHFGLGLLENAVRYRWSDGTLTDDVKARIRINVMSLVAEGSLPLLTEQSFIKEKLARLFVEVAKREWPGPWEDMDNFLRQLFFKDETGREMSLLILRSMCEDICIYDDPVAALRKKDLRTGLLIIMASESVLKEHYPEGVKGHKDEVTLMVGETGNDGWTSRLATLLQELLPRCQVETRTPADEKIAVAVLKTIASSVDWIIISSISTTPIVPLICQSLLSPSEKIRLAGAECYDVLSCRNLSESEREQIIWPLLDEGGLDLISKAYMTYATQILQGEAYEFIQKMVQATVNLGEQQLCAKRSAHVPKNLPKLLQLLFSMASHPSVLIVSIVSFFWTTLLRHDTFSKDSTVHTFVPPLLELYSSHLAKDAKNRWRTDPVYRHFASIDFDSTTEFQDRALQIFQRAVDVIHLGVPIVPLDAFFWVANKVAESLKAEFPSNTNVRDTTQFKSFDGTLTLMEVTISSLTNIITENTHVQSGQVLEAMHALLGILIDYESKCLAALERALATIPAFTDMFKVNSDLLFRSLDKLFKSVEYPVPDKTAVDDTRVGDRAAITLVKIGRAIPNTLYPIYGEIEAAIQRLVQQNAIPQGLRKTLQSFLLVIGFNSDLALNRREIFEKVVQPVVVSFQSQELQEALSSPRTFMAFVGVNELSSASNVLPQAQEIDTLKGVITQRRSRLSRSVETMHVFMKETIDVKDGRTVDLWGSYLSSILPNLFSTIRCLNAIFDEKLWTDVSPGVMNQLLLLSVEEKVAMVTGKTVAPGTMSGPVSGLGVAKLVSDLKIWLAVLRDQSYRVLAQISLLGPAFYSTPSLQVTLERSLFEHVDNINNRQFRLLLNHTVQPLVLNCPEPFMGSALSHLLMVLFPYLDRRLLNDWKLASEEGLVMDEKDIDDDPEDQDVSDGIVKEVMLRDLTRDVAAFLFSILDFGKQKHVSTTAARHQDSGAAVAVVQKEITPLALFILSCDAIAQFAIPLLCHIMTFKDTRACLRAAEAAQRVLTALVLNYPGTQGIIGVFSRMVLQAAMEAIHDPYHQEGQEKLIQLITEVYVEVRVFDEAPKAVFQQALGADTQRLDAFERELSSTTISKTKKNALVRNFLQSIIGVAKSEWFKQKELGDKPIPNRTISGKYERPSKSALDSTEHEDIGEGLASLFDE